MIDIFTNSPDNSSLSSGVAIFSSQNLAQSKTFFYYYYFIAESSKWVLLEL
jgi:restriction endonuclease S subunit